MGVKRDAQDFYEAFQEVLRLYQFRDVERVCEYGISITECHALELIADGGPLSVNELAAKIRLDKSTVSRAVQALAEKKLISRKSDPQDARAWKLQATAAGRRMHENIAGGIVSDFESLLADFDEDVRRGVIDVLRRIRATRCG